VGSGLRTFLRGLDLVEDPPHAERAQVHVARRTRSAAILRSACLSGQPVSTLAPPVRPPAPAELTDAQVEQVLINIRSTMFSDPPLSSAPLLQSPPGPLLSENFREMITRLRSARRMCRRLIRAGFVP